MKKSPSLRSVYFSSFCNNGKTNLGTALRFVFGFPVLQGFGVEAHETLRIAKSAWADFAHDQSNIGPQNRFKGRCLIIEPGKKYTEAKPKDFFTMNE